MDAETRTNLNSPISWPNKRKVVKAPEMMYESLVLLYNQSRPDVFGEHMAFAVSCSKQFADMDQSNGCIQKLEITTAPSFSKANMSITHEVLPGQGACAQILNVNDKLRVACFDSGAVIPISNFGYRRNFHCDVRGRLKHHSSPVNCIATNRSGNHLASGSTDGQVALYEVEDESIRFQTRSNIAETCISGLLYLDTCGGPDNMLLYSTLNGHVGMIDTRCKLGADLQQTLVFTTDPRLNISALCSSSSSSGQIVYIGTSQGQLCSMDMRKPNTCIRDWRGTNSGMIRRMRELYVPDGPDKRKGFVAFTDNTKELKILDQMDLRSDDRWVCDRLPEGNQSDLCVVEDKIVTCGANTSIGCWAWDDSNIKTVNESA